MRKIAQIFVAFSEKLNFTLLPYEEFVENVKNIKLPKWKPEIIKKKGQVGCKLETNTYVCKYEDYYSAL